MIDSIARLLRRRIHIEIRRFFQQYARIYLSRRTDLWKELAAYTQKSGSTGCKVTDYYFLYKAIRKLKPREVLECGTGVSTLVIAHALMENEKETGKHGRVTSMEEIRKWSDMAKELLPDVYSDRVEIVLSPTIEDYFSIFRGMRYRDVPQREYDFVFVDGPKFISPRDNHPTCDFDYLHILQNSKVPVAGLIDQRTSTVFVLQQLIGLEKINYSSALGLCHIRHCTKNDLGRLSEELLSTNFFQSFRVIRKTRLSMHPLR